MSNPSRNNNTAKSAARNESGKPGSRNNTAKPDSKQHGSKQGTRNSQRLHSRNSKQSHQGGLFDDVISLPSIFDEEKSASAAESVYEREPSPETDYSDTDSEDSGDYPRESFSEQKAPCSCIPPLSSSHVPSMLYDRVRCKHVGGHSSAAHKGVVFFNDENWGNPSYSALPHINNVEYHQKRPNGKHRAVVQTVKNYPRGRHYPEFAGAEEDQEDSEEAEEEVEQPKARQRAALLEARQSSHRSLHRKPETALSGESVDVWALEYDEEQLERKHCHSQRLLDPATGKVMDFSMRTGADGVQCEKSYQGPQVTKRGYITATLGPT